MTAVATATTDVPSHVKPDQVFPFDVYHDEKLLDNPHTGYMALREDAAEIFYTPLNGGHWVVTRYDLVEQVLRDYERFSNREIEIPKTESPFMAIPINLDPPEHTAYRVVLMRHFTREVVAKLEPSMKRCAGGLIDRIYPNGGCDFTEVLGAAFPVTIFMELMGLPLERADDFRAIVKEFFSHIPKERRIALQREIFGELEKVVKARMAERRDDVMSRLIDDKVDGRPLTMQELLSISFLLFAAGLDTVANMMTFTFHHLAQHLELQDRLRENPGDVAEFVEEALRRFSITNGVRLVKTDTTLAGATLKAGDMILAPMSLAGLDKDYNPDPAKFDVDRETRKHLSFSTGPHHCLGHLLARAEMRMFVQQFLARIPRFRVKPGFKPQYRAGIIMALEHLDLEWDVKTQ